MSVIAYDRPVKDLIAALSATGHVTHTAYRKTSVTLHHNGARLSHEGVLAVWQTREASTQFDADGAGAIAQFVNVNEYAWSCGNTEGNMRSIHIEMANSALAPGWTVGEATWKSAARLAGWLFAKVIGVRPDASNFFVHSHWFATSCAGPYIASLWSLIMAAAQASYDNFKGVVPSTTTTTEAVPDMDANQAAQLANIENLVNWAFSDGSKTPFSDRGEITHRLRSIDANTVNARMDPAVFAAAVVKAMPAAVTTGTMAANPAELEAIVRKVFADAGTP